MKTHELEHAQDSPHDGAAVTSFVGARVAATWGRRCVTGVHADGAQLVPAQHRQEVFFPWGRRAVARLVRRNSITSSMRTSTGGKAWKKKKVKILGAARC